MVLRTLALITAALGALVQTPLVAQSPEPIRHTLRFPAPHTHYVEVETVVPTGRQPSVELYMAVWTPGSYLIREYERHVEAFTAKGSDGAPRAVAKSRKNRWRIDTGGAPAVTVHYRVYGREMTVRTNWIEAGFAMLNGAPTFLTLVEPAARPHEIRVELPAGWTTVATPLDPVAGSPHTFRAPDFDTVVDSPMILGNPVLRRFEVGGKPHVIVLEGDPSLFDADRNAADTKQIVEASARVFGNRFEYPRYYFQTLVTDAGGGLEHKNSTMLMTGRFTTRSRRAYLNWLSLVAHEYFHNWNVKRLRPVELGPFDYENEVYTRSLWMAEGFTDYYAGLVVHRAELSSRDEFLDELSGHIEAVQTTPGRLVTAVGQASYDTWIKQYRPDENTSNTTVNYYPKGAVIAFLLDAKIRAATGGQRSLDDGMRLLYERYSGARGFTPEELVATLSETAGADLKAWFHHAVETTGELDYGEALEWFGLRFRPVDPKSARAWLGAGTRADGGRLLVTSVRRGTPAFAAGLNVDDEILAVDDVRVHADGLAARLEQYRSGDRVRLLVARRDRLVTLDVTLGTDPGRPWRLEPAPAATDLHRARLAAWLGR
ncbi:MAG: PDZ domain-containing protein [Acidobacteriota bacterium]